VRNKEKGGGEGKNEKKADRQAVGRCPGPLRRTIKTDENRKYSKEQTKTSERVRGR